jgi:hypothetical protein
MYAVMYAVIGRWNMDPGREVDQSREVRDVIVPMVTARPGFVAGYWSRDPETGRSHTTIVWETEESAREFKELVDESRQRVANFGVTNDFLVVTDVLAEVHR